ncbi:hypothetical protein IMZ48_13845 [Candidatus Bathyarchaeota archaeon]|nr:hypothetical protein [Candidatus Bathyarchaeota archaeon]
MVFANFKLQRNVDRHHKDLILDGVMARGVLPRNDNVDISPFAHGYSNVILLVDCPGWEVRTSLLRIAMSYDPRYQTESEVVCMMKAAHGGTCQAWFASCLTPARKGPWSSTRRKHSGLVGSGSTRWDHSYHTIIHTTRKGDEIGDAELSQGGLEAQVRRGPAGVQTMAPRKIHDDYGKAIIRDTNSEPDVIEVMEKLLVVEYSRDYPNQGSPLASPP